MKAEERIQALREADSKLRVFGSRHHKWMLNPCWSNEKVAAFERRKRCELPAVYRRWLTSVGSSGAGPGNGLFEPGTIDTGGGPKKWTGRRFGPLSKPFPYSEPTDTHKGGLPGAMPLSDLGCGIVALLVTAGPQAGRIWVDRRNDTGEVAPEDGLDFDAWIDAWLTEAEREVSDPWQPAPKHANEPDTIRPATEVVGAEDLSAWLNAVHDDLASKGKCKLPGKLGEFRHRGSRVVFNQGQSLHALLTGVPLKEEGVAAKMFSALAGWTPWTGIQVPGLFCAWVRQDSHGKARDYLGRPMTYGREGLGFTVRMEISLQPPED
jgi:hypothetical protein